MKTSNFLSKLLMGVLLAPAFIFSTQASFDEGMTLDQNSTFLYRAKGCPGLQTGKCFKKLCKQKVATLRSTVNYTPLAAGAAIVWDTTITNNGALTTQCNGTATPTIDKSGCYTITWSANTTDTTQSGREFRLIATPPALSCKHVCNQACQNPCAQACNGPRCIDSSLVNQTSVVTICACKGTSFSVVARHDTNLLTGAPGSGTPCGAIAVDEPVDSAAVPTGKLSIAESK